MNQDGLGFQVVAGMDFHFDIWSVWLSFLWSFLFYFFVCRKGAGSGSGTVRQHMLSLFIDQPSFLYDEKKHMRAEGVSKWYQAWKGAAPT